MSLNKYKQLREVGMRLSQEIPKIYSPNLLEISRILGMTQGKEIVFEDEEEINFLIDFCLFEHLSEGQNILERYRADHPKLKPIDVLYLDMAKASYTSLFKVIDVNPKESTITVVDLLNEFDQPLSVINVNLSKTAIRDYVIFSRLLSNEELNCFSGMVAVFDEGSDRALLKRYKVMKNRIKSDRESVQRFVACFKLKRARGKRVVTRSI